MTRPKEISVLLYLLAFLSVITFIHNMTVAENYKGVRVHRPIPNAESERDTEEDFGIEQRKTQRPWLVLHVGPPKTGTTTIQMGLDIHAPQLASTDNVFYIGTPAVNRLRPVYFRYQEKNNNSNSNSNSDNGISSLFPTKPFLNEDKELLQTLRWHSQQKHNIVFSSELFTTWLKGEYWLKDEYFHVYSRMFLQEGGESEKYTASKPDPSNAMLESDMRSRKKQEQKQKEQEQQARRLRAMLEERNAKEKYQAIQERRFLLSQIHDAKNLSSSVKEQYTHPFEHDDSSAFAFNVKVVVAYRHYFQWLPSFYYQNQLRNNRMGSPSLIDYVEAAMNGLGEKYHAHDADFTNATWLRDKISPNLRKEHGTLFSYLKWSAPRSLRDRVDIFDMHQQQIKPNNNDAEANAPDLLRDFVCQAIPAADFTCSKLLNNTKPLVKRERNKGGGISALQTGKMTDTLYEQMKQKVHEFFPEIRTGRFQSKQTSKFFETNKNFTWEDSIFYSEQGRPAGYNQMRKNFESWTQQRAEKQSLGDISDDGHRQLCLGEKSIEKLRNISWNILRHLEALVRLRDDNQVKEGSGNGGIDSTMDIFSAPDFGRPEYPLLLSPNKYDRSKFPSESENLDWWGHIRRAHDDLFNTTIESGAYCELDLDRLFADEDFLKHLFFTL